MAVGEPLEAEQLDSLPRDPLREPRSGELGHRGGRARRLAAVEEVGCAEREKSSARELAAQRADPRPGGVEAVRLLESALERVEHPREPAELLGGDPLEVERVHEHVPAAVDLTDEVLGRDLDAVEEHLAEVAAAEHREAAHLDPRAVERRDEDRDAAVARLVRVRAHREVDPVGEPRARRPDLVTARRRTASPRRSARVVSDARSLPAPGSEKPWQNVSSPRAIGPRSRSLSSGDAKRSSAQPIVLYERR